MDGRMHVKKLDGGVDGEGWMGGKGDRKRKYVRRKKRKKEREREREVEDRHTSSKNASV